MLRKLDRLPRPGRAALVVGCVLVGAALGLLIRDMATDRSIEVLGAFVTPSPTPPVDCDAQPEFCSTSTWSLDVSDGRVGTFVSSLGPLTREEIENPSHPILTLDSTALGGHGDPASHDEAVRTIRMELIVRNDTDRTFTFPNGELAVRMTRDGAPMDTPVHRDGPTRLEPGEEMTATIDVEVPGDGAYAWQGVTRYEDDG